MDRRGNSRMAISALPPLDFRSVRKLLHQAIAADIADHARAAEIACRHRRPEIAKRVAWLPAAPTRSTRVADLLVRPGRADELTRPDGVRIASAEMPGPGVPIMSLRELAKVEDKPLSTQTARRVRRTGPPFGSAPHRADRCDPAAGCPGGRQWQCPLRQCADCASVAAAFSPGMPQKPGLGFLQVKHATVVRCLRVEVNNVPGDESLPTAVRPAGAG